jgi:uncharacterized protein (TIRG00374 family)
MSFLRSYRVWIGLLISLFFLWLALHGIPFQTLSESAYTANYLWIIPAIVAQLLAVMVRSQRWIVLLNQPSKFPASFWAQSIGYLFTNILPLRMGEPARILVMAEKCNLPVMFVTGTAVVERLLDVATILLALTLILPWMQVTTAVLNAGLSVGLLIFLGLSIIVLLARYKQEAHRFIECMLKYLSFLPKTTLLRLWDDLIQSITILLDWRLAVKAIGLSLVCWLLSIMVYWCVIRAFQVDGLVIEAVFMVVALSLAVTIPSSPGFIGVFQFAGQQALVLPFGEKYNSGSALAITMGVHLVYYLLTTLLGVLAIWVTGTSFSTLTRKLFRQKPPILITEQK